MGPARVDGGGDATTTCDDELATTDTHPRGARVRWPPCVLALARLLFYRYFIAIFRPCPAILARAAAARIQTRGGAGRVGEETNHELL